MPTPATTQILDEIGLRLANITVANGYFNTVSSLKRAQLEPFRNQDMPAINYYSTNDVLDNKMAGGVRERTLSVIVEFYDTTRDDIFVDIANKLNSDVTIALERDTSAPAVSDDVSHSLGGIVVQLEESDSTPAIGKGQNPYCGSVMLLNVTYRVNRHDPFTLIT